MDLKQVSGSATVGTPPQQAQVKLLLSVPEAAAALSIGQVTMWKLVGTGTVRSVKVNRARRISIAALEEYVARLEEVAQTA